VNFRKKKNNETLSIDLAYIICKIMNQPNNALASLLALKRILRIKSSAIYEHHACPSECVSFPYLPKKDWMKHMNDKCPVCNAHRFHFLKTTSKGRYPKARRKNYIFGISSTIIRFDIVQRYCFVIHEIESILIFNSMCFFLYLTIS
jgi:hypothetical protein